MKIRSPRNSISRTFGPLFSTTPSKSSQIEGRPLLVVTTPRMSHGWINFDRYIFAHAPCNCSDTVTDDLRQSVAIDVLRVCLSGMNPEQNLDGVAKALVGAPTGVNSEHQTPNFPHDDAHQKTHTKVKSEAKAIRLKPQRVTEIEKIEGSPRTGFAKQANRDSRRPEEAEINQPNCIFTGTGDTLFHSPTKKEGQGKSFICRSNTSKSKATSIRHHKT